MRSQNQDRSRHHFLHVAALWVFAASAFVIVFAFFLLRPLSLPAGSSVVNWIALTYSTEPRVEGVRDESTEAQFGSNSHTAVAHVQAGEPSHVSIRVVAADVVTTLAAAGLRMDTVTFWIPSVATLADRPCRYWEHDAAALSIRTYTVELPKSSTVPDGRLIELTAIECDVFHVDELTADDPRTYSGPIVTLDYSIDLVQSSRGLTRSIVINDGSLFALPTGNPGIPWSEYGGVLTLELMAPAGSRLVDSLPTTASTNLTTATAEGGELTAVYVDTTLEAIVELAREAALLAAGAALAIIAGIFVSGDRYRTWEWVIPVIAFVLGLAICLGTLS